MFYKQYSDAQDCYKELLTSLDDAKVDTNKKLKIQKETLKVLVNNCQWLKMGFDDSDSIHNILKNAHAYHRQWIL
jgi:hypothetical protein